MDKFIELLTGASGGFIGAALAAWMDRDGRTMGVLAGKVIGGAACAYYATPLAMNWLNISEKHAQSAGFIVGLFGIVAVEWVMKFVKDGGIADLLPWGKKDE